MTNNYDYEARAKAEAEFQSMMSELSQQEQQAKGSVYEQAEGQRRIVYTNRGDLATQIEKAKGEVRQQKVLAERRRDLISYNPQDVKTLQTQEKLATLDKQAQEAETALGDLLTQVNFAEEQALADIAQQVAEQQANIETAYQEALAAIAEFEATHIRLDNGEWVDKTVWDNMTPEEQALLKSMGISGFNDYLREQSQQVVADQSLTQEASLQEIRDIILGKITPTKEQKDKYDVDKDGKIDTFDLATYQTMMVQGSAPTAAPKVTSSQAQQAAIQEIRDIITGKIAVSPDLLARYDLNKDGVIDSFDLASYQSALVPPSERGYVEVLPDQWVEQKEWAELQLTPVEQAKLQEIGDLDKFNRWLSSSREVQSWGDTMLKDSKDYGFGNALHDCMVDDSTFDSLVKSILGTDKPNVWDLTQEQKQQIWDRLSPELKGRVWSKYQPYTWETQVTQTKDRLLSLVPGYVVVTQWDELNPYEKGFYIAADVLFLAPFVKPVVTASRISLIPKLAKITTQASNSLKVELGIIRGSVVEKALSDISEVIRTGNSTRIAEATDNLRMIGEQLAREKVPFGNSLINQAEWIAKNADKLASKQTKIVNKVINLLDDIEADLTAHLNRKVIGGVAPSKEAAERMVRMARQEETMAKKVAPPRVAEHAMSRSEFESSTEGLTRTQKEAIARNTGNRTQVEEQIAKFKSDNAKIDKTWREIEESIERTKQEEATRAKKVTYKSGEPSPYEPEWKTRKPTAKEYREAEKLLNDTSKTKEQIHKEVWEAIRGETKKGAIAIPKAVAVTAATILIKSMAEIQQLAKVAGLTDSQLDMLIRQAIAESITEGLTEAKVLGKIESYAKAQAVTNEAVATKASISLAERTKLSPKTEAAIKQLTRAIAKVISKPKIETQPRLEKVPSKKLILLIKGEDKKEGTLTKEQLAGAIGWKQGFMYKVIYPPYKDSDIINSREPVEGIRYYSGVRSAYESLRQIRKGDLPPSIFRNMGIMDIRISTTGNKPKIKFKRDEKIRRRGEPEAQVKRV